MAAIPLTKVALGVSHVKCNIARYLAEFDFRYSNRSKLGIEDAARADLALVGAKGKRLTYRTISRKRTTATPPQARA